MVFHRNICINTLHKGDNDDDDDDNDNNNNNSNNNNNNNNKGILRGWNIEHPRVERIAFKSSIRI